MTHTTRYTTRKATALHFMHPNTPERTRGTTTQAGRTTPPP